MNHKQNLFEARTQGYWTCRIPGLAVVGENVVLATAEARPGRGGDYDFNDILLRRSTDGGRTFALPVKLVDHATHGPGPASNFVMIPDRANPGHVAALFHHDYARAFSLHSDDAGATWSDPLDITDAFDGFRAEYPWRVCANGCGRGLQLRNGRMIVPVWLSDGSGGEFGGKHRGHRPSIVASMYSDDGGRQWRCGGIVARHGDVVDGEPVVNPSETSAVELADGRVLFNLRSESAAQRRLIAISPDGAGGWSGHRWDAALLDPVCMGSLARLSWEPNRIIFCNPDTLDRTRCAASGLHKGPNCDRKRLTVKLSPDDGRTWPFAQVIEEGPSAYSAPDVLPDGTILCLYECEEGVHMFDTRCLRLARFSADWIAAGKSTDEIRKENHE
jgi:sialidase-1